MMRSKAKAVAAQKELAASALRRELDRVCAIAEKRWGYESQITCMGEECCEFAAAFLRRQIGKGSNAEVLDEMADVYIISYQMMRRLGPVLEDAVRRKLARTEQEIG